jgi:hypothetical protein
MIERDSILFMLPLSFTGMDRMDMISRSRLRAAELRLALLLFQHKAGHPAKELSELVQSGILERLPTDPFSGADFHYRLSAGEVLDWKPNEIEKWSKDFIALPVVSGGAGMAPAGMGGAPGASMAGPPGGMAGEGGIREGIGIVVGGALAAANPHFFPVRFELNRYVPPGTGILWSVGPDGVDDGGTRQGHYAIGNNTFGTDAITLVPKVVK